MKFTTTLTIAALSASLANAGSLRSRELQDTCGTLVDCYLVDLNNKNKRTPIRSTLQYSVEAEGRYSVLCQTKGNVNYAKFQYNGDVKHHWNEPFFYMNGNDPNSDYINDEKWLKVPGVKKVKFTQHIWSKGDEAPCVTKNLSFTIVGNLLKNGSFEENPMPFQKWKLVNANTVKGWNSLNGNQIELWGNGVGNIYAAEGNGSTFIEMDARGSGKVDGIYQDVVTTAGQYYKLAFSVRARDHTRIALDDEKILVSWNGVPLSAAGFVSKQENEWEHIELVVKGTGKDRVLFKEVDGKTINDGSGPLLDAVSLTLLPGKKNLLANGSFEENPMAPKRYIVTKAIKGWKALNAARGVELWGNGVVGVTAAKGNGKTMMELDIVSDKATDGIYQNIKTVKGKKYLLSFFVNSRRGNFSSSDEAVVAEWNGVKPSVKGYHAVGQNKWTFVQVVLVGTGRSDQLKFRESVLTTANNGLGAILDEVSLIAL